MQSCDKKKRVIISLCLLVGSIALMFWLHRIHLWNGVPYGGEYAMNQEYFIEGRYEFWLWYSPFLGLFLWCSFFGLLYPRVGEKKVVSLLWGFLCSYPLWNVLGAILLQSDYFLGMAAFVGVGCAILWAFYALLCKKGLAFFVPVLIIGFWFLYGYWYMGGWFAVFGD